MAEDTHYTLEDRSGDLVTIVKKYEMKAQEPGGKMSLKMSGQGKLTFDAKVGLPEKMDYQGTIEISQGNVSVKFPVTLAYEQTDGKTSPEPAAVVGTLPPAPALSPRPRRVALRRVPRGRLCGPDKEFVPVASQGGKLAVRASGIEGNKTPDLAFDGDKKTAWGAGGWPVQWIEADLLNRPATAIKLTVAQLPASETEHEVWISEEPRAASEPMASSFTASGATKTDDLLEFTFPANTTASYVQIRSLKSQSWVAWPEIDIQRM